MIRKGVEFIGWSVCAVGTAGYFFLGAQAISSDRSAAISFQEGSARAAYNEERQAFDALGGAMGSAAVAITGLSMALRARLSA